MVAYRSMIILNPKTLSNWQMIVRLMDSKQAELGKTRRELAHMIGIGEDTLYRVMRSEEDMCRISFGYISKIVDFLGGVVEIKS